LEARARHYRLTLSELRLLLAITHVGGVPDALQSEEAARADFRHYR
jgi:hypothetical protein